ncbi:MAG: glycosyltransferase family 39 protein [Candidatus Moranbacteria bacterium]|nr:glycosyltransferase family 39 protein [Candidatus Moranbacteria bacterium]
MKNRNEKIANAILISAIVLTALFLRIYKIDSIPAGIYPDESVNGTDAILANETGDYKIFYTNNYGREGLFMNLISFSIKIFGNTILGIKFWSILFGTLTVLGIYLLTKELFRSTRSGLIAAYLLAFSFWAINFSRISFRAIMVPFLLTFSFYFLFRGLRTKHYLNFILAGLIFGLGFHTYIAFRIAPLILVSLFIILLINRKNFLKENWKPIIVFAIAILVVVSPMLYDFVKHPEHFQSRSGSISVFSSEVNKGHLFETLGKSLGLSLIKYNFWGDQNWRHNYPPYPILNPIAGFFFLTGLIYLVIKTAHLLILRFRHGVRDKKFEIYLFLLAWFVVMLMPEFLTAEGLPHALRSIGTMPVVFIIATISILWVLGRAGRAGYFFKLSVISLLAIAFISIGATETIKYFVFWNHRPEQHGQFNENLKNMSLYLNSTPASIHKYVFVNGSGKIMEDGLPISAHVIKYLTYRKAGEVIFLKRGSDIVLEKPMVIILMGYNQGVIDRLKTFYPNAKVEKIDSRPGYPSDFIAVIIN